MPNLAQTIVRRRAYNGRSPLSAQQFIMAVISADITGQELSALEGCLSSLPRPTLNRSASFDLVSWCDLSLVDAIKTVSLSDITVS